MSVADGLHPGIITSEYVPVNVGGLGAVAHVTILDVVAVLPQASIAVHVLVWVALQLVVDTGPSLEVTVGVLQPSVAVAVPSAALISEAVELQPSDKLVPFAIIVGGVRSEVQLAVLDVVVLLLQPSIAVHVLVCDLKHPLEITEPSLDVNVGAPQASEAVAVPSAAVISDAVGLQPKLVAVPFAVIVGVVLSVTVTFCRQVLLHPFASVTLIVNV